MPVLKIKNENGTWTDVGISGTGIGFASLEERIAALEENGVGGDGGTTWHYGTLITGEGDNIFMPVASAKVGDFYLNTETGAVYVAVSGDARSIEWWRYLTTLAGEKGENGSSGVHVGSSTPPANANIWIDPDGDPTSVEDWEFDLDDGTTENKTVVVLGSDDATEGNKAAFLRVRDENGDFIEIPALIGRKGDKGDKGDSYVLTDADKVNIASQVKASLSKETWTFTLEDGSKATKAVYVE